MKANIFIATPMYGGQCTGHYTQSLLQTVGILKDADIGMRFCAMFNESLVQRARNALTLQFLKSEATHLMFIDADIHFNPHDIVKMVEADKEIICGIYPKKEINWPMVERAVQNGVPADQLKHYTGSFVVNLADQTSSVTVPINEPVEIWNGGTGFMLIKREVFQNLEEKVNSYVNDVIDVSGTMKRDRIYEYFPVFIEKQSERLLSEDYAFCKIARENGIKVWAAPWARLGHMGSYLFEGGLLPAP
ncbi:MAG: hypothetical protein EBR82_11955 [Caulobacteraceae bacterium]|nr:hypothetical protein [Caulobacteraceae bacterium]